MDRVFSQERQVSSTYNVGAKFVASHLFSLETTNKGRFSPSNMGNLYCLKQDNVPLPTIYLTLKSKTKLVIASSN